MRKTKFSIILAIGLSLGCAPTFAEHEKAPSAKPASAKPSPAMAPDGDAPLTKDQAKQLSKEFQKAQTTQLKALDHRQKSELKELKLSQSTRFKEWEKKETELRHQYFAEHSKGPERRAYVRDFIDRRKALLKTLGDEKAQMSKDHDSRRKALLDSQSDKLKEFQAAIQKGEHPSKDLWPEAGN